MIGEVSPAPCAASTKVTGNSAACFAPVLLAAGAGCGCCARQTCQAASSVRQSSANRARREVAKGTVNAECGMMNERPARLLFIIHHSSFITSSFIVARAGAELLG